MYTTESNTLASGRTLGSRGPHHPYRGTGVLLTLVLLIAAAAASPRQSFAGTITVTAVTPSSGGTDGSTVVKLTGSGFAPHMDVWFGAQQAPVVAFVNSGEVYIQPPAHSAGHVSVGIIESVDSLNRNAFTYTYVNGQPAGGKTLLTSVSPASATVNTSVTATLNGANFQQGSRVRIAGVNAASVQVVAATQIKAVLPAMSAGSYTVEVVNPDNSVASLSNAITYLGLLNIVTTGLPGATVGKPYGATLEAAGGKAPYVWSASGTLPQGILFNAQGTLSGSPAKAGTSSFTATVKDASNTTKAQVFSLVASPAAKSGSGAATGQALTSCQAINSSGSYYLDADVTCTSQGFAMNADNISFNLNGHTITYGGSSVVPAISVCDQWYAQLPKSSCGNARHANLEVYNGKIVQAKGSAAFNPAIWIGQANGLSGGSIHDLSITIQETGAQAIHGDFPGLGWKIQNNVFNDNVTNIQHPGQSPLGARAQFQGNVIHFDNGQGLGAGDVISGNTFNGSPQGGILDSNQNTQIYGNVIHLTSRYSNDYGIVVAEGQNVYNNVVDGRGRGIDAESSNFTISGNTINVREEANNSEYGGCQLSGSDGIRVKNYAGQKPSTGWKIENNTITVDGRYCVAHGLRFTDVSSQVQGTISNNTFTTTPGPKGDFAISFSGVDQPQLTYIKNSFTGSTCAQIDNDGTTDGANTLIQAGQRWSCSQLAVSDGDLAASGYNPFSQALTIQDNLSNRNVWCGPYARGKIVLGSYTKQCNR